MTPPPWQRWSQWGLALLITLIWILPLGILLMNSFKTAQDYTLGSSLNWPQTFNLLTNIQDAWGKGLGPGFVNSLIYGVLGAVGAVFCAALAAFGIVRLKIPRGLFWFLLLYSGTVFPFQMYLIPLFNLYLNTQLYDTRLGMLLFYIAICIPFCVFVMRGFFLTVPWELQEAATLDGASSWGVFWRLMMPLARAPLILLLLIQFSWIWNDLLFGLILTKSDTVRPIMVTLVGMQGIYGATSAPTIITAALIASLPTLLLFLFLQRYFIQGLTVGVGAR